MPKALQALNCYDCGFEWHYDIRRVASDNEKNTGLTKQAGRTVTPRMTVKEFASILIVTGKMADLEDKDDLRKLSGTFLQVCHGWIASDVQKEPAFWHETAETIRKRATRFMRDFSECRKADTLTPLAGTTEMSLEIPYH